MGVAERRLREKENRRVAIMDAAERVFFASGIETATMDDVAEAAELSKGLLYFYFKNKDDVLITIFEEGIGRLLTILREVAESDEPFENRVTRIVELQLGLLEELLGFVPPRGAQAGA